MFWSVGIRSSTFPSSAGSGSGARDRDLIKSCSYPGQLDRLIGDFTQRDNGVLVVVAIDGEFLPAADVARALSSEQNEFKPVGKPFVRNLRR